jgi:hypothetical protein
MASGSARPEPGEDSRLERLLEIVEGSPRTMEILRAVRDVDPPRWAVGAGAIRELVWHRLHGFPGEPVLRDVDVAFFDPTDLRPERDLGVEERLRSRLPGVPWQAKNQAAVHLWYERRFGYPVDPLESTEDAVATWPETASCVAVRLHPTDTVEVIAPLGLADLFHFVLRRNPRRVSLEEYRRRPRDKRFLERWPRVRFIDG